MFKRSFCFLLTFIIASFSLLASPIPSISAEGAILIEPKTNTILYAKNANKKFYPASTTKILTTLILLEDMPSDTVITKTKESTLIVPSDSSQIPLKIGDQYTASEGLYAVLLASDNFVCHDMAVKDSGSIRAFSKKMNEMARSAGAVSSHFVNPHGYHEPEHYTTPFDLSQIGIMAFNNAKFTKIAGTLKHTLVTKDGKRSIPLKHSAVLLDSESPYYNPNVVGAKTGFHTPAKRTLIAKATYENIELIGIIMRTDKPNQFEDMNTLFEYGTKNYSLTTSIDGIPAVFNHSYSPWAKSYIHDALEEGWLTPSAKNYQESITRREFINLLRAASPENYKTLLDKYVDYDGVSIYKENLAATRKEAALICYSFAKEISFNALSLPINTNIIDKAMITAPYQNAVDFVVTAGVLGQNGAAFKPDDFLTYEQAIAVIQKLKPVIDAYSASDFGRLAAPKLPSSSQ